MLQSRDQIIARKIQPLEEHPRASGTRYLLEIRLARELSTNLGLPNSSTEVQLARNLRATAFLNLCLQTKRRVSVDNWLRGVAVSGRPAQATNTDVGGTDFRPVVRSGPM